MSDTIPMHPGHDITVTRGPFGRSLFECSCGEMAVRASKSAGVRAALAHHHDNGPCNCPPSVVALPEHGPARPAREAREEAQQVRYWLTRAGYDALAQSEQEAER